MNKSERFVVVPSFAMRVVHDATASRHWWYAILLCFLFSVDADGNQRRPKSAHMPTGNHPVSFNLHQEGLKEFVTTTS